MHSFQRCTGLANWLCSHSCARTFFLQAAGLRTSVYFDYVPSKANIADLPSRGAIPELLSELRGMSRARDDDHVLRVPHVGHWMAPLASWVSRFLDLPGSWPV